MMRELLEGKDLSYEAAQELFCELATQSDIRKSATLTALQAKGVTGTELAGFAQAMRDAATPVAISGSCDTCGTGGDKSSSINVSTASAILLSCHTTVAKHGNGSVTSKSGSSTLISMLGIGMPKEPEVLEQGARKCGFAYLHAPYFHPALAGIMPVRRELGFPTIFNIVGPLANPAAPESQLIGVNSPALVVLVAEALAELGTRRAVVVHGNGVDEVHPSAKTSCALVEDGEIMKFDIYPSDLGMRPGRIVPCNSPEDSAKRILQVLQGEGTKDDKTFLVLNASMALYATGYGELKECKDAILETLGTDATTQLETIRDVYPLL